MSDGNYSQDIQWKLIRLQKMSFDRMSWNFVINRTLKPLAAEIFIIVKVGKAMIIIVHANQIDWTEF